MPSLVNALLCFASSVPDLYQEHGTSHLFALILLHLARQLGFSAFVI
jgi:hypothetical protein